MKKIYFTMMLLLLCTASVFSAQLYCMQRVKTGKVAAAPARRDSSHIISGMLALPPF